MIIFVKKYEVKQIHISLYIKVEKMLTLASDILKLILLIDIDGHFEFSASTIYINIFIYSTNVDYVYILVTRT